MIEMETGGIEFLEYMLPWGKRLPADLYLATKIKRGGQFSDVMTFEITISSLSRTREMFENFIRKTMKEPVPCFEVIFHKSAPAGPALKKLFFGQYWYTPVDYLQSAVLPAISKFVEDIEICFEIKLTGLEFFIHADCIAAAGQARGVIALNDPVKEAFTYRTGQKHLWIPGFLYE